MSVSVSECLSTTLLARSQEKKLVPFANHVSCTVEMVDVNMPVDVAVVDEIQMIGDQSRGWAWTRALMGVPVRMTARLLVCQLARALFDVACGCVGQSYSFVRKR